MEQPNRPKREDLIGKLRTRGWDLVPGGKDSPIKNRTLEELVRLSHERHQKGEPAGLIRQIENAVELDLIQIQELWAHLGLPM